MNADEKLIILERISPAVSRLVLNRPQRRNALSIALMRQLRSVLIAAAADESLRVILMRGAGPAFCAGLDLEEAAADELHHSAGVVAECLRALVAVPAVTVAVVHGAAMGGGAGIMAACDHVVAEENAKIGFPEVRRGLVAALILAFLRRQLRDRDLRELLLGGGVISAEKALAIGLVNRVVPSGTGDAGALEFVREVLQGAPGAIARTKTLLARSGDSIDREIETALHSHLEARASDEAKEGIAAFLEKRPPRWVPAEKMIEQRESEPHVTRR